MARFLQSTLWAPAEAHAWHSSRRRRGCGVLESVPRTGVVTRGAVKYLAVILETMITFWPHILKTARKVVEKVTSINGLILNTKGWEQENLYYWGRHSTWWSVLCSCLGGFSKDNKYTRAVMAMPRDLPTVSAPTLGRNKLWDVLRGRTVLSHLATDATSKFQVLPLQHEDNTNTVLLALGIWQRTCGRRVLRMQPLDRTQTKTRRDRWRHPAWQHRRSDA